MIGRPSLERIYIVGTSRLYRVSDWPSLAQHAEYCCEGMAASCGVSGRQLERFFHREFETTLKEWVQALRMNIARHCIEEGYSTKATAADLRFKGSSQFCRAFKRYFGAPPQFFAPIRPHFPKRRVQHRMSALVYPSPLNST